MKTRILTILFSFLMSSPALAQVMTRQDFFDLAKRLKNSQNVTAPSEVHWIETELNSFVSRLDSKTEKTYQVYGANSNVSSILAYDEIVKAQQVVANDRIMLSADFYKTSQWLLHRLVGLPEEKLEILSRAKTLGDVDHFFRSVQWSRDLSADGALIQYSNNQYTQPIRLTNENLNEKQIRNIVEALRKGVRYSTDRAKFLSVKYIKDSNDLAILEEAGFKRISDRLGLETFTHTLNKSKIVIAIGDSIVPFTREDQLGFLHAAVDGVDYVQPAARKALLATGKPTPREWQLLQQAENAEQVVDLLVDMNWKSSFDKDHKVQSLKNPVFQNVIRFQVPSEAGTYLILTSDEKSELLSAIEQNQSLSFTER